jgi:hypothetical protein
VGFTHSGDEAPLVLQQQKHVGYNNKKKGKKTKKGTMQNSHSQIYRILNDAIPPISVATACPW